MAFANRPSTNRFSVPADVSAFCHWREVPGCLRARGHVLPFLFNRAQAAPPTTCLLGSGAESDFSLATEISFDDVISV